MEDLENGWDEKSLINFVKTVLLSGNNPRGKEALINLHWGIRQYRKHLILQGVSGSLPVRYSDLTAEKEGQKYTLSLYPNLDEYTDITGAFKEGMKKQVELINKGYDR